MTARQELLIHLWKDVINNNYRDASLNNIIAHCRRDPTGPFGDTGAAEQTDTGGRGLPDVILLQGQAD